ncbi:negative regulator of flagellin synthesis FlgM [Erythromicrobium ramosum]|uniref:Flagellar biosynthesis anti-sigma factor FlgM n=1 Tax=Erythrobacter ramosus TaxID=35811 RepID=A0A6I4UHK2_9SPHN|nr:flagellar biosynthesis anti-sigma factor FlgM [Erythrobacter ramosus]MBB3774388.1 negative regulator of flagellin synthesis FlgM [Erythrobacter ramosus]MXP37958.1 flagellar biosynthesis anti-sigma factor FlgM [Erythrobacter ramosus]
MPSVELSKLPGVSAARALSTSDRAQIDARSRPAAAGSTSSASGISVEVTSASEAASPPVDAERVARIRDALRDGSYPLVPAKIVDAMIAAQVSLSLPERS